MLFCVALFDHYYCVITPSLVVRATETAAPRFSISNSLHYAFALAYAACAECGFSRSQHTTNFIIKYSRASNKRETRRLNRNWFRYTSVPSINGIASRRRYDFSRLYRYVGATRVLAMHVTDDRANERDSVDTIIPCLARTPPFTP